MRSDAKTHDVGRLCDALGLDPAGYVKFEKQVKRAQPNRASVKPIVPGAVGAGTGRVAEERGVGQHSRPALRTEPLPQERSSGRRQATQAMLITVLSPSGGSGKTTLATALACALLERRHSVLLADHSPFNTMQTWFGLSGEVRSVVSFAVTRQAGLTLPIVSRYDQGQPMEEFDSWFEALSTHTEFTLVDGLADAAVSGTKLLDEGARILIPVVPDEVPAAASMTLDRALRGSWPGRITYVLNRFDASVPMHQEVRNRLRQAMGARLLPFEIPEDPMMRDIAAGAATIRDMAPHASARLALESIVELLEQCAAQQNAEVRR